MLHPFQHSSPGERRPNFNPSALARVSLVLAVAVPYISLGVMSLGSGWTYPSLLPDRIDGSPWRRLMTARSDLLEAIGNSAVMSLLVGSLATLLGLFISRFLWRVNRPFWRYVAYLPFVLSPVVVGVTLDDLLIRVHLAGTAVGVMAAQLIFATSFSSIFWSGCWSARSERLEQLVRSLGGSEWSVWRHAIFPRVRGLGAVCFLQAALFSWMDFGLASLVGGGQVTTVTVRLFAYLREANANQAALASIILLLPAVGGCLVGGRFLTGQPLEPLVGAAREVKP